MHCGRGADKWLLLFACSVCVVFFVFQRLYLICCMMACVSFGYGNGCSGLFGNAALWIGLRPGRDVCWGRGHQVLQEHGGDTVGLQPVGINLVSCLWCHLSRKWCVCVWCICDGVWYMMCVMWCGCVLGEWPGAYNGNQSFNHENGYNELSNYTVVWIELQLG